MNDIDNEDNEYTKSIELFTWNEWIIWYMNNINNLL